MIVKSLSENRCPGRERDWRETEISTRKLAILWEKPGSDLILFNRRLRRYAEVQRVVPRIEHLMRQDEFIPREVSERTQGGEEDYEHLILVNRKPTKVKCSRFAHHRWIQRINNHSGNRSQKGKAIEWAASKVPVLVGV